MLLSLVHSSLTSLASLVLLWRHGLVSAGSLSVFSGGEGALEAGAPGAAPVAAAHQLLAFSAAYFTHDLVSTLPDWGGEPLNIVHHVLGLVLTGWPLLAGGALPCFGHHILLTEISTPPLNAMWFSRKMGGEGTRAFTAISMAFVALFFTSRLLYLPLFAYLIILHLRAALIVKAPQLLAAVAGLLLLNLWWWGRIVAIMMKPAKGAGKQVAGVRGGRGGSRER